VSSLAKAGETSSIERVFEKLDAADIEIGSYCYNALIAACVRQQDVDRAQKWLKIASQRDLADVASFSAVMHAYAKNGQVEACEDVFQAMEEATTLASQEDQYGEWNCKLCGSAQSKRGYQCRVCGGQMVQRARSVVSSGSDTKCIRANVVTFNCLINACAQCGDAKRAEMYLNKMLAADLRPTLTSFNTLLNACVKGGCIDRAEHWIRTMPSHGVSPCGVSYSTLINACVAAGDTSRAEDWMSVMTDPNSRTSERPTAQTLSYVYNTVITGLANKKKAARVQHWLEDAHRNDIVINRVTYKLAGDVLHSAGRCDKANDCFMRAHNAPCKTQYKEKPGAAKGSAKGKGNAK
jgi:pentatricopeptide repeat protein